MYADYKKACVFGGSGFVGRQVVRELAALGYIVKVASRVPERAYFLKTAGNVGQIVPFACNYADEASLAHAVAGCDVVVNCIGILAEKGKCGFDKIHRDLPAALGRACAAENVSRFIHISALGCDRATSKYGKSKIAGEVALLQAFPAATVLRPSIIFGADDGLFNRFARLSVISPALPLIGGGTTKFQPVYVGDVADAVIAAISNDEAQGKIYELGGPRVLTFRQIFEEMFAQTRRPRVLVSLPWGLAKFQGAVLGLLPYPPLTADQVESLKTDAIVAQGALSFADLGLVPSGMEAILPSYLARYRPGGRFGDKKRA